MATGSPRTGRLDNRPESQKTAVRRPVVGSWKFLTAFSTPNGDVSPTAVPPPSSSSSGARPSHLRSGLVTPLDPLSLTSSSRPATSSHLVGLMSSDEHLVYNPTAASDAPDVTPFVTDGEGVTPVLRFQNVINAAVEAAEQRVAKVQPPSSSELLARFSQQQSGAKLQSDLPHQSAQLASPTQLVVPHRRGGLGSSQSVRPPPTVGNVPSALGAVPKTRIVARIPPPEVQPLPQAAATTTSTQILSKQTATDGTTVKSLLPPPPPPPPTTAVVEQSPVATMSPSASPPMSRSNSIGGDDSLSNTKNMTATERHVHFGAKRSAEPKGKGEDKSRTQQHRRTKRHSSLNLARKASTTSTNSGEWVAAGGVSKDDPVFKILSGVIAEVKEDCEFVDPVEVAALDNVLLGLQHANMHRIYGQLHSLRDVSHDFAAPCEAPIASQATKTMVNTEAFPIARRTAVETKPPRTLAPHPSYRRHEVKKVKIEAAPPKSWKSEHDTELQKYEAQVTAERKVTKHFSVQPGTEETPPSRPLTPASAALQFVEHRPPKSLRKYAKQVVMDDAWIAAKALENVVHEPDMEEFERRMVVGPAILGGTQQIIDAVRHLRLVMPPELQVHYDPERLA